MATIAAFPPKTCRRMFLGMCDPPPRDATAGELVDSHPKTKNPRNEIRATSPSYLEHLPQPHSFILPLLSRLILSPLPILYWMKDNNHAYRPPIRLLLSSRLGLGRVVGFDLIATCRVMTYTHQPPHRRTCTIRALSYKPNSGAYQKAVLLRSG